MACPAEGAATDLGCSQDLDEALGCCSTPCGETVCVWVGVCAAGRVEGALQQLSPLIRDCSNPLYICDMYGRART